MKPEEVALLEKTGLLYLMNKSALHPYGFHLTTRINEDGETTLKLTMTDSEEGALFNSESYKEGESRLLNFELSGAKEILQKRKEKFGFIHQNTPFPNQKTTGYNISNGSVTYIVSHEKLKEVCLDWFDMSLETYFKINSKEINESVFGVIEEEYTKNKIGISLKGR